MEKRQLGNSEVKITPLAFGAWAIGGWMWGGADRKDAEKALETSIEMGMTTIDTAPVYGFGLSETIVGGVIRGKRDKVEILTKYGLRWDRNEGNFFFPSENKDGKAIDIYNNGKKESIIQECEESLKRLGTDYIDLYQMHWPDPSTPVEETMEAILKLSEQGKIRAAGVSNFDPDLLEEARKIVPVVSDQVPYSMVKRDIEDDLLPYCREENIGILAYSPLQRGVLTGKFTPDYEFKPGDSRPKTPYFTPDNIRAINEFLGKIEPLAKEKGATLAQLVLRWTIEQPGITCALAGARDPRQVKDNIGATGFDISETEINQINQHLSELSIEI